MFGTLADIRNELRVRLGLPERGDSGDARLDTMINMALRQIWSEMPKALLSKEHRFMMQPALTPMTRASTGYTKVNEARYDPNDPRVLKVNVYSQSGYVGSSAPAYVTDTLLATDGTHSGRTIELNINGTYHYRKIQSIYSDGPSPVTRNESDGGVTTYAVYDQYIVLNEPLPTSVEDFQPFAYRLLCEEYPYPDDVQQVLDVIIDPENNPHPLLESTFQNQQYNYRATLGYRNEGRPETYTRGSFFQLPAPSYKPEVENTKTVSQRWGFDGKIELNSDNTGVDFNAGTAGSFKYIVVHVWGRQPDYNVQFVHNKNVQNTATEKQAIELKPFYRSGASVPSEEISTKWGAKAITIKTPNIDYVYGYGSVPASKSYEKFGYEKYIFRSRLTVDNEIATLAPAGSLGPHSSVQNVEADSKFYLLAIIPGYQTEFVDNGSYDPVSKSFPLEAFNGHFHIKFDRQPTEAKPVLMRTYSRPPLLRFSSDTPRLPPDCYDALYALTASYLVGDRDGEPARKSLYFQEYQAHLKRLRKTYNVAGHQVGSFGNGLSTKRRIGPRRNRTITESS